MIAHLADGSRHTMNDSILQRSEALRIVDQTPSDDALEKVTFVPCSARVWRTWVSDELDLRLTVFKLEQTFVAHALDVIEVSCSPKPLNRLPHWTLVLIP